MKTWECIDSVLWESWGSTKVCRECGYPEALKTFDGHESGCTLGMAAREFASALKKTEPVREANRQIRLESWGIEVFEAGEIDDGN